MKNINLSLIALALSLNVFAFQDKVQKEYEYPFAAPGTDVSRGVFGEDDRKEVKDAEGYEDFVRATGVMISKENIYNNEFYSWSLREKIQNKYGKDVKISEDVRFLDQPAIGSCSGFLIAPDILVTAGHCINSKEQADQFVWVFDYTSEMKFINNRKLNFKKENIFEVESVITSLLDDKTQDDYAVLRLKRKSARDPYRFRTSGSVLLGGAINTIGSPKGLPLKFSTNAEVIDTSPSNWFKSDIDSFPGNSGGPVFDENGFLEGILVRGAVTYDDDWSLTGDFYLDASCNCIKTVTWTSAKYTAGCQAHRITSIPGNVLIMSVYENLAYAIEMGLNDRFKTWHIYKWIYNYNYTNENGRLELLALNYNNLFALESILDVTREDLSDDLSRQLIDKAMSSYNSNALELILSKGVLADAGYNSSSTALQRAVQNNQLANAKLLLQYGANASVTTSNKDNLLHLAARTGNMELAELLVANGVSAKSKNSNKMLPEKVAKKAKHKNLAKYLKKVRKRQ